MRLPYGINEQLLNKFSSTGRGSSVTPKYLCLIIDNVFEYLRLRLLVILQIFDWKKQSQAVMLYAAFFILYSLNFE